MFNYFCLDLHISIMIEMPPGECTMQKNLSNAGTFGDGFGRGILL